MNTRTLRVFSNMGTFTDKQQPKPRKVWTEIDASLWTVLGPDLNQGQGLGTSGNKLYCAYISPSKQEFCYNRDIIKYCNCMATVMRMLEIHNRSTLNKPGPSCQNDETSHRTLHFAVTILFVTRYVYHPLSPALPAINTVINLLPYTEREGC